MNTVLVLVAFVAAWMVAGVILATAFGPRLRRCADAAAPARREVVLGADRRGVEPLRWVLPASIVVMAVASSTGLAAAGVLPARVQVVARSVFGTVGLDVPDASDRFTAEGGGSTPGQAPAPAPVPASAAPGPETLQSGDQPVSTAPSAAGGSSDPFLEGLAVAVAHHLGTAAAGPTVPTPGGPATSGSDTTGPAADDPPAAVPPRDATAPGQELPEADAVPDVPAETGTARPPEHAPPDLPAETGTARPPKHAPPTHNRPPTSPAAVPPPPVAPVVEPPSRPATAPALPPPAATPPGQAVPGAASPAELARQAREQRWLEKEQEKAAKKAQAEQVAPVGPPPAVDPAAPEPPALAVP